MRPTFRGLAAPSFLRVGATAGRPCWRRGRIHRARMLARGEEAAGRRRPVRSIAIIEIDLTNI